MKTSLSVFPALRRVCLLAALLTGGSLLPARAEPVIVTDLPPAVSVNLGDELTLTVVVSSSESVFYQWFKDGALLPGATGASYRIASAIPSDNGKYRVVASDNIGSTASGACTVAVVDTYRWAVISDGAGSGTVSSSPPGIDCGFDCEEYFAATGPAVTLTATPSPGSVFAGWSEDGVALGNATALVLPMTAEHSITATFAPAPPEPRLLTVNKSGTGGGTVLSTQPVSPSFLCLPECASAAVTYAHNTTVILTATADTTSTFTGWDIAGANAPTRLLRMEADKTLIAIFTRNTFPLSVFKTGTGGGIIASSAAGIDCGMDCQEAYPAGSAVTLTVSVSPDSIFTGWSGAGTTDPANPLLRHVTMDAARSVTASFAHVVGSVIAKDGSEGGGGDAYFEFFERPQIDDSGRVLFHGSLAARSGSAFLPAERKQGLWYSRSFIRARRANAIFGTYATLLLANDGASCVGNSLLEGTEQCLLTPAGDIVVYAPDPAGVTGSRLYLYSPHIASSLLTCSLVEEGRPMPLFERVTLPMFLPEPTPDTTNYWGFTFSSPAYLGSERFTTPMIGDSRYVAFVAGYGRYEYVDGTFHQPATNRALVSVNPQEDLGLRKGLPDTFITPPLTSLGGLIGNGQGGLAGYGSFELGGNSVPGVWTLRDHWLARFGTPSPGLPPEYLNPTFRSFSQLAIARDGAVAFTAGIHLNGASVVGSNAAIYLHETSRPLEPVSVSGRLVTDGALAGRMDFSAETPISLAEDAQHSIAFAAKVDTREAIVLRDTAGLRVAVVAKMAAPGHGPEKFLFPPNVIGSAPNGPFKPFITSDQRIIFFANVGDGTNWFAVKPGVWIWEPPGIVRPLLQVGDHVPSFGLVDAIEEPAPKTRFANNAGQVTVVAARFPDGLLKKAIIKVSRGGVPRPFIAATPVVNGSGRLILRIPAIYGDAAIERNRNLGSAAAPWETITPTLSRIGDEYIAEIVPSSGQEFFRLALPDDEAP